MIIEKITPEWLAQVGFKWHQLERQPDKHWLLWIGNACGDRVTDCEDLGVELAPNAYPGGWYCWLRSDTAGRYHRFLHVRHLYSQDELVKLIEGLTGLAWDQKNIIYGSMLTPVAALRHREEACRLDRRMLEMHAKWSEVEKDDTRGRALPEHMEAHAKQGHGGGGG